MQQWEYFRVGFSLSFPRSFDSLGADGWELVSIVTYQEDTAMAFFKRPLPLEIKSMSRDEVEALVRNSLRDDESPHVTRLRIVHGLQNVTGFDYVKAMLNVPEDWQP